MLRQPLGVRALVDVDLGGAQMRVFGADHPHQTADTGLLQVELIVGRHRLRAAGHDEEARRLARGLGQFAGDPHQVLYVVAAQLCGLVVGVAVPGSGEDHHPGEPGAQMLLELIGVRADVGLLGPDHRGARRACSLHRVGQVGRDDVGGRAGADQQPRPGVGVLHLGQFAVRPLDGQQAIGEGSVLLRPVGDPGAQQQTLHRQPDRSVFVEQVDVGFDPGRVGLGDAGVAVVDVACGAVGPEPADAERQPECAVTESTHLGMGLDGLEAGVEQRRVHPVGILLRADLARQRDLGHHRVPGVLGVRRLGGGVHVTQSRERRAVLHATGVHAQADGGTVLDGRMRGEESGHVVGRWLLLRRGMQHRRRLAGVLARLHCLDGEVDDTGCRRRGRRAHGGLLVQQQRLLELEAPHLDGSAEYGAGRGERHLAVRGAGQHRHVADLVVAEPGLGDGADLALPHVPLRFLQQVNVFAEQGVDVDRARAVREGLRTPAGQPVPLMRPGGQWRVDQPAVREEHGEVDRGTGAVDGGDEIAHTVRQFLFAAHPGERGQRRVDAGRGLLERPHQQGVR